MESGRRSRAEKVVRCVGYPSSGAATGCDQGSRMDQADFPSASTQIHAGYAWRKVNSACDCRGEFLCAICPHMADMSSEGVMPLDSRVLRLTRRIGRSIRALVRTHANAGGHIRKDGVEDNGVACAGRGRRSRSPPIPSAHPRPVTSNLTSRRQNMPDFLL